MSNLKNMMSHKESLIPKEGYNLVCVDSFEFDPEDVLTLVEHYDDKVDAESHMNKMEVSDGIKYFIYDKNTL